MEGGQSARAIVENLDQPFIRSRDMNKDQVKGGAKDLAGKVQQQAGKMTGSKEQQAKGLAKQASGKVQKNVGDAKEAAKGR